MSTLSLIIHRFLKTDNNVFLFNYDKKDPIELMYKLVFTMLTNDKYPPIYTNKFDFLKFTMYDAYYKSKQEGIFYYFYRIQRIYNALNRFVYLCKFKRAKIVSDYDLELNKLSINDRNVMCIYHSNAKYLFKIQDLLKIINTSLLHHQAFFVDPNQIKNPYNNMPFEKSILYSIYVFYQDKAVLPHKLKIEKGELFSKFYECNFNMSVFTNKYEYLLRQKSISDFVNNSVTNTLYNEIVKMINIFNRTQLNKKNRLIIDRSFPKDNLVKIMKPYLLLYMNSEYSLIPVVKTDSTKEFIYKLKIFQKYNPQFGRKKYVLNYTYNNFSRTSSISDVTFNDHHNRFVDQTSDFLDDHLSFRYLPHVNQVIPYDEIYYDNTVYNIITARRVNNTVNNRINRINHTSMTVLNVIQEPYNYLNNENGAVNEQQSNLDLSFNIINMNNVNNVNDVNDVNLNLQSANEETEENETETNDNYYNEEEGEDEEEDEEDEEEDEENNNYRINNTYNYTYNGEDYDSDESQDHGSLS
jgi:hypothetical protein